MGILKQAKWPDAILGYPLMVGILYIYIYILYIRAFFLKGPEGPEGGGTLGTHPKKNPGGLGRSPPENFWILTTFRGQISLAETSPKSTFPIEAEGQVLWAKKSEND